MLKIPATYCSSRTAAVPSSLREQSRLGAGKHSPALLATAAVKEPWAARGPVGQNEQVGSQASPGPSGSCGMSTGVPIMTNQQLPARQALQQTLCVRQHAPYIALERDTEQRASLKTDIYPKVKAYDPYRSKLQASSTRPSRIQNYVQAACRVREVVACCETCFRSGISYLAHLSELLNLWMLQFLEPRNEPLFLKSCFPYDLGP